jgi:hypothetical protein
MVIATLLSGGGCFSASGGIFGQYADETGDSHPGGDYLLRKYGLNRGPASGRKCYQPQPCGAFLQSRKNVREHTLMGMSKKSIDARFKLDFVECVVYFRIYGNHQK